MTVTVALQLPAQRCTGFAHRRKLEGLEVFEIRRDRPPRSLDDHLSARLSDTRNLLKLARCHAGELFGRKFAYSRRRVAKGADLVRLCPIALEQIRDLLQCGLRIHLVKSAWRDSARLASVHRAAWGTRVATVRRGARSRGLVPPCPAAVGATAERRRCLPRGRRGRGQIAELFGSSGSRDRSSRCRPRRKGWTPVPRREVEQTTRQRPSCAERSD